MQNIKSTRGYRSQNALAESIKDNNIDGAMNTIRKATNKRYSQSTYMLGRVNG